ncbi:hypothetical protein [Streptomyces sp. NPDC050504]|uniref:hypothetical protein n=1 Tax=Streptomyces sp. NPDC050504 TaxID=3365618 RepID=UPI0037896498
MGWTVLYIAFGIVALWLLGEVLLQYKARLRYRLLAFTGFVGVVIGVLVPSVVVIALGAIMFAVGQTYVTLSFRRGFSTGWALGGLPGVSKRRKGGAADREPVLEVSDLEYGPDERERHEAPAFEPQPLPDETGQYGVYDATAYQAQRHGEQGLGEQGLGERGQGEQGQGEQGQGVGHGFDQGFDQGGLGAEPQPQHAAFGDDPFGGTGGYDTGGFGGTGHAGDGLGGHGGQPDHTGHTSHSGHDTYAGAGQYDYGTSQQYAAYSDPYIGSSGQQSYGYDSYGGQQQFAADAYGQQGYADTPPGGVWVPHQRDGEQQVPPPQPHDPSAQHQSGYDTDYGDQQRYRY